MNAYLMGFDIGTGSSKALLTDAEGNIAARYAKSHEIEVAHPGWQEESMDMWWEEFKEAVREFLKQGICAEEIRAIGVTGLIPALCPIDCKGNALRNAILHTDVRTETELEEVHEKIGPGISHGHMLPKVLWLKKHEPEIYQKIYKIMVPHGFLAYRLTGEASIDYDAASMIGGVFDESALAWEDTAFAKLGIDKELFADPVPATKVIGKVSREAAEETGLSSDTKVIAGVGDTFASILGGGAYNAGHLMIYLGTSATVLYTEKSPEYYTFIPHYGEGKGHFVGKIASFGESTMHLRNCLRYEVWDQLNAGLRGISPGSEGLWYFPHYKLQEEKTCFGADAEHMLGFRGRHTQFHMYHAMLEGIAYNVKYNIEQFPYLLKQINIFGGGANSREIIQIFADVIGQEVYYNEKASTALGIAFLAGYGSKEIEQYSILPEVWFGDSQRIAPNAKNVEKYKRLYVQYEELRADLLSMDKKYAKRRS